MKWAEKNYESNLDSDIKAFIDSWKYQGKIYRVIHAQHYIDNNNKLHYRLPKVRYHKMVTHWTTDYNFKKLQHKLSPTTKCIILEADTLNHFGFDVNKFRKSNNCENFFTEEENEIIFPMFKENIKEYHMTIAEFIDCKESICYEDKEKI